MYVWCIRSIYGMMICIYAKRDMCIFDRQRDTRTRAGMCINVGGTEEGCISMMRAGLRLATLACISRSQCWQHWWSLLLKRQLVDGRRIVVCTSSAELCSCYHKQLAQVMFQCCFNQQATYQPLPLLRTLLAFTWTSVTSLTCTVQFKSSCTRRIQPDTCQA